MQYSYYLLFKPFGYLSQFTREHPDHKVLGDLYDFPTDVYPVGRLDKDSEGLLILTNDKRLNHHLLNPDFQHERTYWVQVEGIPTQEALEQLQKGVDIRINKKRYHTLPARANRIEPPKLPDRIPPVRFRKNIPDRWISLTLIEGKNRQVRRMCAQVGFPVLRLVRAAIEGIKIGNLQTGKVKILPKDLLYKSLNIKD